MPLKIKDPMESEFYPNDERRKDLDIKSWHTKIFGDSWSRS
jgi:hypothetical protein